MIDGGELWLEFGDVAGGDDERGVQVGHRIQQAAQSAGFNVDWPGSIRTHLRVHGFNWQRRSAAAS